MIVRIIATDTLIDKTYNDDIVVESSKLIVNGVINGNITLKGNSQLELHIFMEPSIKRLKIEVKRIFMERSIL